MKQSADSIICFLENKKRSQFTGGIKLGFEHGRPVSCSEYSDPEQSPPPVHDGFNPADHIQKACTSGYYGSLLFIFKQGAISHFSSVQTWKGQSIASLLEDHDPRSVKSANLP